MLMGSIYYVMYKFFARSTVSKKINRFRCERSVEITFERQGSKLHVPDNFQH